MKYLKHFIAKTVSFQRQTITFLTSDICGDKLQISCIIFLIPDICHLIFGERKVTYFSGQTGVESTVWEKPNIFKHLEVWSLRQSWRFGQQYPRSHHHPHHHRPIHHHHHCDDCQVGDWGVISSRSFSGLNFTELVWQA